MLNANQARIDSLSNNADVKKAIECIGSAIKRKTDNGDFALGYRFENSETIRHAEYIGRYFKELGYDIKIYKAENGLCINISWE